MRPIFLACAAIGIAVAGIAHADDSAQPPLYYQDPDGKPFYAAGPSKTADGRDYKPVFVEGATAQAAAPPAPMAKQAGGERRILYYRNPMGLPDTSPVPKKDAMGMDYRPVYADGDGAGDVPGTVRISPGRLQTLGVRTAEVVFRPTLTRTVRATGSLQFDERHLATVTTKVAGWIEHLAVAATGDPVRRGQVLAEIYAPDLVAAEEEYLVAARMGGAMADSTRHGDAGVLVAASLQRLRALDVPDDEIARLRRTGQASRRIAVRAPADGVVIEKPVQEGMRIEPGQPLYKTADLADVWLMAEVQEQDLGAVQPGAQAEASFVAFPGRTFTGTVDFIYPVLSTETRTARVRVVIPNPDRLLRAAMYANVQIAAAAAGPALAVPTSAVIDSGTRQVVLIDRGEGRFEPRPVHLGVRGDDWVQVLDGVTAGEKVVTGANFLIDAESNLRTALQGFAAPPVNPATAGAPGGKP